MRLILRFDIQTIQVGDYNCLNFDDNTWSVRLRPGTELFSDNEVMEKSIWFRVAVSNVCMLPINSNAFQLTFRPGDPVKLVMANSQNDTIEIMNGDSSSCRLKYSCYDCNGYRTCPPDGSRWELKLSDGHLRLDKEVHVKRDGTATVTQVSCDWIDLPVGETMHITNQRLLLAWSPHVEMSQWPSCNFDAFVIPGKNPSAIKVF
jgi:hypothetical protein